MSDSTFPAFQLFSFLGFLLVLVPLPWHLQALNGGTCLYMIWVSLGCLNLFVNSIVWHNNTENVAPVWCDISTRLTVGLAVAIPAVSLCINRRLYNIATIKTASLSIRDKRRALIEDLCIGVGLPVLQMILQIVVSGHRFNIIEDIGCYPFSYNTWLTIPLVSAWPLVIGLVSAVYCVLTIWTFLKRRAQMADLLSSHGSLTVNRYLRLMGLASTELFFNTPLSAYGLYLNIAVTPMNPYKSWADTHYDYSKVDRIPALLWRSAPESNVTFELSRWAVVFCAFLFFALFGFADEARRNYRIVYNAVVERLSIRTPKWKKALKFSEGSKEKASPVSSNATTGSLPLYVPRPPIVPMSSYSLETGSISSMCSSSTIVDNKTPKSKLHIDLNFSSSSPTSSDGNMTPPPHSAPTSASSFTHHYASSPETVPTSLLPSSPSQMRR